MTQEQKELLLKDLCARLPYGVKVQTTYINPQTKERKDIGMDVLSTVEISMLIDDYEEHKPYLFPLSSITKEQWNNAPIIGLTNFTFESFKCGCFTLASYTYNNNLHNLLGFIDWLIANHFDIYDLISMDLAIDATYKNIY